MSTHRRAATARRRAVRAPRGSRAPVAPVIRPATDADVPAIHRLEREWAAEGSTYGVVPDEEEYIRGYLGPLLLVAEAGGEVVGFIAGARRVSDGMAIAPAGTPYAEIDNLYVTPAFRRRRIGGQLVERWLEAARADGARKVLLYSATKDVRGVLRFYERHGFRSWYVQMFQDL